MSVLTRRAVAVTGAAAVTLVLAACGESGGDSGSGSTLKISANAVAGGKNEQEAKWIEEWVIPKFVEKKKADGEEVKVTFEPSGVDDEQYKTKLALDLQGGSGPDIMNLDGIWIGEFAQAGYIKPLPEVVTQADFWDGWDQIPDSVQKLGSFENERYGIPAGTDGRVLYYNKDLFEQAGLDRDWQPTSWDEMIEAAEALNGLDGVTPIQLNAGTAMGEATTMQGFLPLLAGAGEHIWDRGKWRGDSEAVTETLALYETIYGDGLGDPLLQQEAQGRDKSFEQFADNRIGILLEGDYFWRSVVSPDTGIAPMEDRDEVVGYAKIPAIEPGGGIHGQDFASMSGGSARVLNPETDNPELAFELLTFMNSEEAVKALLDGEARITARTDVNEEVLADDPMLKFVSDEVLPVTAYRPGLADYTRVSTLLQEATAAVVSGSSAEEAAEAYRGKLEGVVGGAGNITN
ncbi:MULTISPECIES: extracellular solute-binding protein [Streptomyces]|uniref:extracellular solute-binding protein n=1 Tax=Streptomyces TaxID=1883 RepID=UPI000CD52448|nr:MULTISPECIES: extracellular solute-binding protein [Streptomyces]